MQRLLNSAIWDADLVRDDLRAYILERLGDPHAVLVIDESSFRKRGKKSAGVARQHCGTTGHLENCQVGVFLAYTSAKGHTLLDRELYLPMRWIKDRKRCQEAGIPDTVRFQTKCEQARQMIERLWEAKIPFAWVVADTVYGGNADLRTWLETHGYSYVLAVACDEPVEIQTPQGLKCMTVAEAEALTFHEQDWQRLSMSQGTKGPRLFDWAVMPMLQRCEDDGRHFLLIRRCVDDPTEKAYYFVFAPLGTTLIEMVQAIGQRWKIEECFEIGKAIGLEDYEVRGFTAWYRYITLVMVAQACLAGICAAARTPSSEPTTGQGTSSASFDHSRSASFTCVSALATASQSNPAAFLVLVAALPSEPGQLLSYQTSLCRRVTVVWLGQIIIFSLLFPMPGNLPGDSLDLTRYLIVLSH